MESFVKIVNGFQVLEYMLQNDLWLTPINKPKKVYAGLHCIKSNFYIIAR